MKDALLERLAGRKAVIGVVGLGYVGLPLVLAYAARGFRVVGFDIDPVKIGALSRGESYIKHIGAEAVAEAVASGRLAATSDFAGVAGVDAVILCVPTPLDRYLQPDLSYVVGTVESVVPHMRAGQVMSLESTTYPGTTEEELRPRIEGRGFRIGEDAFLVYSPEREDPGNKQFASTNIPKVVGGSTAACLEVGVALYGAAVEKVVPVRSTRVAEFTKLLENIYRAVNIGLVNELKVAADRMGIDIWEVIEAASTKPFGFKAFHPGPGLGGHCIPIDPFYLTWKAREYGVHTRFIELAGEINRAMPEYVVQRTMEALNGAGKAVKGSRVLVLGLAYKEDVDDMRESPSFPLMDQLLALGAAVDYHDPHIPVVGPTREHMAWAGVSSVRWEDARSAGYDAVVISTHHSAFDLADLLEWAPLVVDTRNAVARAGLEGKPGQIVKA